MRVLIVDHDPAVLAAAARAVQGLVDSSQVTSKSDCLARLREGGIDIVVACERLADGSGLDLLATLGMSDPDVLRIFAADGERLKKLGGHLAPFKLFDTIGYPPDPMQLKSAMALAIAQRGDLLSGEFENIVLGDDAADDADFGGGDAPTIEAHPQIVLLTRDSAALEAANVALAGKPYRVIAARDADEARADLVARRPVLALIDVGALGMDPVNWFVEAHRASATTVLLALGRRDDGQRLEPLVASAVVNRFVSKPVTQAGMRLVLDSALRLQALNAARAAPPVAASVAPLQMPAAPAAPAAARRGFADAISVLEGDVPLTTVEWRPTSAGVSSGRGGGSGSRRLGRGAGRFLIPGALTLAAALAIGAAWLYFSRAVGPEVPPAATATTPAPVSQPSVSDSLIASIEAALTRDDLAGARAALEELQRVDARHPRAATLATLIARAEETQRLARAPAAEPRQPAPIARLPAPGSQPVDATESGAAVSAPALPDASAEAPAATPTDEPTAAPDAAPATTPVAAPTDLRPSKLTAVSFSGRTPVAPIPVAENRHKPVVMDMKLLRSTPPDYPEDAWRKKIEGSVELQFIVASNGKVKDVAIASSTPPGVFDDEALAAVKRWRYDARREDGVPVDHPARVRLEFKLDE